MPNSTKKKILSDSIFLTAGDFLMRFKGVVFIPLIISAVGLENYGIFVQVLINPKFIIPFCALSLGMGFYRYTSTYDDDDIESLSRDFWSVVSISFLLSFIGAFALYYLSPAISHNILGGLGENSLRLSSVLIPIGVMWEVLTKFIQARKRFKFYTVYNILYSLVPYFGFLAGIVITHDIFWGLVLNFALDGLFVMVLWYWIAKDLRFIPPSISVIVKFIKYSWALVFSQINGGLLSKVDRYFIGYFLGPASIGIYNIVYAGAGLLSGFAVPFQKYTATYLPKLWDEGHLGRVRGQLKEGLIYFLIFSLGTLVIVTFYFKPAIVILLGKNLSKIEHFNALVFITGLGIVSAGSNGFFYQIIRNMEKNYFQFGFETIAVIVNVILNYLLIPIYGIIGAGIATFVSYFLISVFCNIRFSIDIDKEFIFQFLRIAVSTISVWVIFKIVPIHNIFGLLLGGIGSVVCYLFSLFLLRVLTIRKLKERFA